MRRKLSQAVAVAVLFGCQVGYVPSDVPGVCQEAPSRAVESHPEWVSDEKPPQSGMPSWQAEGANLIEAPSLTADDEKMDKEKADADAQGKKRAGIK